MRTRGDAALVAALAVDATGNGLFTQLSLLYFTTLTGMPIALVGVLVTVANLVALPLPVGVGALADRVGPRPLVVGSELLMAVGFVGYAAVSGPVGVLLAATAVACGVRVFWCTVFTLIADVAAADPHGRGTDGWFAIANAARTAGLAVGPLVTGVAVSDGSAGSYRLVAVLMAGCLAAAGLLIATGVRAPRRPPSDGAPTGYADLLRDRPYLGLVTLNTVYALTSLMLALALPVVVASGIGPPWLTAVLLAANAVLITVLSAPLVRRLARYRRTRSVAAAAVLWTLWCLGLAVATVAGPVTGPVVLVVGTVLFTVAEAVHAPVSTALAEAAAPAAARGRYLAVFQYSFAAASVVAPAFFATLYDAGHALPFLVLAAVNAVSVLALRRLERVLPAGSIRAPRATMAA